MPTINTIDDVSNIRSIGAAVTANAGAIAIQNVNGTLKQVDDQGNVTGLGGGGGGPFPLVGTLLTDANQTLQPVTDAVSQYTQSVALTANRTKTLGVTSSIAGLTVYILRSDTANFTLAIINGGPAAGTMLTFAAAPATAQLAAFYFNGTDWTFAGFFYVHP